MRRRRCRVPDLALDIEVVAPGWDELDEHDRDYLLGRARSDEDRAEVPDRLALQLGLAQVVAIGMWLVDEQRGKALVAGRDGTELDILTEMWIALGRIRDVRVVTFNGRGFDAPVVMIRSAVNGLACLFDLIGYRYDISRHCDLADALGFQGATRSMYSLDWWCRRFGVPSPKAGGVDGKRVGELWVAGEYDAVATYVEGDARATGELYHALKPMLCVFKGGPRYHAPAIEAERLSA
jgi:3'-5' exonuclease